MKSTKRKRGLTSKRVGLIGIGLMGTAMAERCLAAGYMVAGWDINPERGKALEKMGGIPVESPKDVLSSCRRIVLSLPDSKAVAAVLRRAKGNLQRGQLIIDTSTGDPTHATKLGRWLARKGVAYVDATISGNSEQVRQAAVVITAGGTDAGFAQCRDLFGVFSRRAFHTGKCGSGARMKLVTNLVLGLNRAALAEGLAFAEAAGVNSVLALRILQASAAYSRCMDTKGRKMVERDFQPQARLSQHLKDVRLILAAGRKTKANLPLTKLHKTLLQRAEAMEFGPLDNSAIICAFETRKKKSLDGSQ